MTAPLSQFLTRFSAPLQLPELAVAIEAPVIVEPVISMTQTEFDGRIDAASQAACSAAEERHSAEIAALAEAHETASMEALARARAEWADAAGDRFASLIDTRLTELRTAIADRVADVLRPLLAEAVRGRTADLLTDAVDRLLSDATKPAIRICGPEDLVACMRAARPEAGIEWIVAEEADVTIVAGATRIESQLATALTEITETSHVG